MKTLLLLFIAASAYADSWFLQPSAGLVFPNSSAITYHSMAGRVDYKTGYSEGLAFGRNLGNFKLYVEYNHASFKARDITLSTPYGKVSQSDSDNQDTHVFLANLDYSCRAPFGFRLSAGGGVGAAFDGMEHEVIDLHSGIQRRLFGLEFSLRYSYRFAQGQERLGKKSNGSYSIVLDRPDQQMLTLSIGNNF